MNVPDVLNGIKIPKKDLIKYCKKRHIKKMALFGSLLNKNFSTNSDIDILVEFEIEHIPSLFNLIKMEDELSSYFMGHKVDLRTPNDLSKYFRNRVIKNAVVLYAGS